MVAELPTAAPDWELAQTLWTQNVPRRTIAERCNVSFAALKMRASRGDWSRLRNDAVALSEQSLDEQDAKASKRIQNMFIRDIDRSAVALQRIDPQRLSLNKLEVRERVASMMQKRAWSTLGLDGPQSPNVVNITMLSAIADAQESLSTIALDKASEPTAIDRNEPATEPTS